MMPVAKLDTENTKKYARKLYLLIPTLVDKAKIKLPNSPEHWNHHHLS